MIITGVPYIQGRNAYGDSDGNKYAIAIHNTSNVGASARDEASYASRREDGISAHFYVDEKEIIQSLNTRSRAGHAGSRNGNEHAIAFEIRGVNSWTRKQWLDRVCWDKVGRTLAILCQSYSIAVRRASIAEMVANPKVRAFYGHNDMRLAWGGTTHTDPGPNFPWDHLFRVVKEAMNPPHPKPTTPTTPPEQVQKQRRVPDMLMFKLPDKSTVYLSWGPDRGYVALKSPSEMPSRDLVPLITVPDMARLEVLAGRNLEAPAS
jgi:N-acetylmuramoyl-L-alanine amidase CwlA